MGKTFSFFLAVLVVIFLAFLYLNETSVPVVPNSFDNAQSTDRCAEFRSPVDEEKDISLLGYGGRIRQLLHGCF